MYFHPTMQEGKAMTKRSSGIFSLFSFIFIFWAGPALADEVNLLNGDKLTGIVVKVEGGKLTLRTSYAGSIEVRVETIKSLVTDEPAEVKLESGEILKGKLKTSEGGKLAIEPGPGRELVIVDWGQVAAVNPPPRKLTGNFTVGGSSMSGNTDRVSGAIGADASIKSDNDRFSLRFLFNYGQDKGQETVNNTYFSLKYDYFFTKKFYGLLALELLKDRFVDLNLRTIVGPGIGYQIWDDPIKFLCFEAGVTYYSEDHINDPHRDWAAARLAGNFRYNFFKIITFADMLEFYPNLSRGGEYTLRNEAALISPLGAAWSLKLSNIWRRDSDPAPGILKDDLTWILGLQYSF
jgi:putative salt-induced outer membrane protein YdiY